MSVTLKDIANRVGKSIPTVSRALAGYEDISPETRALVKQTAAEMGYVPNTFARKLQSQRSDAIGLILPSTDNLRFSDPFFSQLLSGIIETTSQHNFHLTISSAHTTDEHEAYLESIRGRQVDGFIVVRTQRLDPRIKLLQEHNVPFVTFGRVENTNDFIFVDGDGETGVRQIVAYLASLGHVRLGCIAEPTQFTKAHHRVQGFVQGLHEQNIAVDPRYIIETSYRQRSGRLAAHQLLDMAEPPTAIVACNDLLALGAIQAAQEKGLAVGRDISITGFDDILLAEASSPPLTTIHQPAYKMGTLVADKLVRLIQNGSIEDKKTIIQPKLIIRNSTGKRI